LRPHSARRRATSISAPPPAATMRPSRHIAWWGSVWVGECVCRGWSRKGRREQGSVQVGHQMAQGREGNTCKNLQGCSTACC
jgi:hypothetical protein